MLVVVLILVAYMVGVAGYAWEASGDRRPTRPKSDRLLVAGGVSLAAAGVALLIVGVGVDVFSVSLVHGRDDATTGLVYRAFMAVAVAGPASLIFLGVLAARGRVGPALGGAILAGTAYLVIAAVALLPFPGFGDPGPSALGPASPGLLPVALLLLGLHRRRADAA